MSNIQRLILEDEDATYDVFVESAVPLAAPAPDDDYEDYGPGGPPRGITVPATTRVKLKEVHQTIQGYTHYAIGAFKNLAIAEVEEINLKFNLKISAEGGLPTIASAKTEADFAIEVKCKFPENKKKD